MNNQFKLSCIAENLVTAFLDELDRNNSDDNDCLTKEEIIEVTRKSVSIILDGLELSLKMLKDKEIKNENN